MTVESTSDLAQWWGPIVGSLIIICDDRKKTDPDTRINNLIRHYLGCYATQEKNTRPTLYFDRQAYPIAVSSLQSDTQDSVGCINYSELCGYHKAAPILLLPKDKLPTLVAKMYIFLFSNANGLKIEDANRLQIIRVQSRTEKGVIRLYISHYSNCPQDDSLAFVAMNNQIYFLGFVENSTQLTTAEAKMQHPGNSKSLTIRYPVAEKNTTTATCQLL